MVEPVVNGLDILILLYPGINKDAVYFDLICGITQAMGLAEEHVDVPFFDLKEVHPEIFYEAVNQGILLKNGSPQFLGDRIEAFLQFLVENEFLMRHEKELDREIMEAFCAR
ncbi:MAG: hypothetical protein SV775_07210 [Thermodesulfobacteriota bacterium]|nr:hypothetical protein [Thermodesulfobacteriota bacterium]